MKWVLWLIGNNFCFMLEMCGVVEFSLGWIFNLGYYVFEVEFYLRRDISLWRWKVNEVEIEFVMWCFVVESLMRRFEYMCWCWCWNLGMKG